MELLWVLAGVAVIYLFNGIQWNENWWLSYHIHLLITCIGKGKQPNRQSCLPIMQTQNSCQSKQIKTNKKCSPIFRTPFFHSDRRMCPIYDFNHSKKNMWMFKQRLFLTIIRMSQIWIQNVISLLRTPPSSDILRNLQLQYWATDAYLWTYSGCTPTSWRPGFFWRDCASYLAWDSLDTAGGLRRRISGLPPWPRPGKQ